MNEFIASTTAALLGAFFAYFLSRRLDPGERIFVWASYLAHLLAAVTKVLIVYYWYGDGDMDSYIKFSRNISDIIRMDPGTWAWPYIQMGLQQGSDAVPYDPPGDTGATATMYAFVAFHQLVFGHTRFGVSLFVTAFSLASKIALYMVFREQFPRRYRGRVAVATMLIPSAVFWSGALSKEGVLWMSCGWVMYGFHLAAFKGRPAAGVLVMLVAGFFTALVKAYVLFPMVIGFAIWLYWRAGELERKQRRFSPLMTMIRGIVVFSMAAGLVVGLGEVFPRYKVQNFAEEADDMQMRGTHNADGSYYSLQTSGGVAGQLAAAPMGVFTALYRPMIIEATNPLIFVNALETTFLLLLTLYILKERGMSIITIIRGSPPLLFCVTYVMLFSVAVGLTSTNLGTLSRYRMPMMPYFGLLFAALTPMVARRPPPKRVLRRPRRGRGQVVSLHASSVRLTERGRRPSA